MYDLRSDTVTKPCSKMRSAMAAAEVGDDVYQEDPTVKKLEDLGAELTGKESALFVPSGSMGNLIAIFINCGRGKQIIAQRNSHIFHYELGSPAVIAGVIPVPVDGERGILTPEAVEDKIPPEIYYMPTPGMIEIENTHNAEGGSCYTLAELENIAATARKHHLPLHMDGARLFNAVAATGHSADQLAGYSDTVTFCLSKGLGAPAGSILCGSKEFIAEARSVRKLLGGGMRQAGILAAAGIYALQNNISRIAEDHENIRTIAKALQQTDWAEVDPESAETNILYFGTGARSAASVCSMLKQQMILAAPADSNTIRLVTHLDISRSDTLKIAEIIKNLKL